MIIAGIDQSITSPGVIKYYLDNNLNIINIDYLGFTDIISLQKAHPKNLILARKKDFKNDLDRYDFMTTEISKFCRDAVYIGLEGYALNAKGKVFNLAEFCGIMKWKLVKLHLIKLRVFEPTVVKLYAGKGNYNKGEMFREYLKLPIKINLDIFPQISDDKKGTSPLSDFVDATFIAELLRTELKLREGLTDLKNLKEYERNIFLRVTKSNPINLLSQEFILP